MNAEHRMRLELDKRLAEYEEAVLVYHDAVTCKARAKERLLQVLSVLKEDDKEDKDEALADPDVDLPNG